MFARKLKLLAIGLFAAAMLAIAPGVAFANPAWNWDAVDLSAQPDEVALEAQDVTVIDTVYINNASVSFRVGDKVKFTATVPTDAPYTIMEEMWADDENLWSSRDSSLDGTFEKGDNFTYDIVLVTADPNFRFSTDTKLVLNGKSIPVTGYDGSGPRPEGPIAYPEPEQQAMIAFANIATAPAGHWNRLSGATALDTTQAIVQEGWAPGETNTVVLATMSGYYDALAAAPLAGAHRAPILLTKKTELSPQARAEIVRLEPEYVYIVGGEAAVSGEVENALAAMGVPHVERIWGQTAVDTAVAIAENLGTEGIPISIVATSKSYHDALAIAPMAWKFGVPIYLTNRKGELADSALQSMAARHSQLVIVMGGEAAIPQSTEDLINANVHPMHIERFAGATANDTAVLAAKYSISGPGLRVDHMGVATAGGYHDALAGAALCGKRNSVLILVPKIGAKNPNYAGIYEFVDPYFADEYTGYVFGGPAAVSEDTVDLLESVVGNGPVG